MFVEEAVISLYIIEMKNTTNDFEIADHLYGLELDTH
jgi:hypothetical protein